MSSFIPSAAACTRQTLHASQRPSTCAQGLSCSSLFIIWCKTCGARAFENARWIQQALAWPQGCADCQAGIVVSRSAGAMPGSHLLSTFLPSSRLGGSRCQHNVPQVLRRGRQAPVAAMRLSCYSVHFLRLSAWGLPVPVHSSASMPIPSQGGFLQGSMACCPASHQLQPVPSILCRPHSRHLEASDVGTPDDGFSNLQRLLMSARRPPLTSRSPSQKGCLLPVRQRAQIPQITRFAPTSVCTALPLHVLPDAHTAKAG